MGVTTRKQNANVTTTIEKVFDGNNNIVVKKTAVRISPPSSPKAYQARHATGLYSPSSHVVPDLANLAINPKKFQNLQKAPPVISTTEGSVTEGLEAEVSATRSSETRGSGLTTDPTVPDNNLLQPIPEQPSNEKTVTICTGELKAFFPVTCDHMAVINKTYYAHLDYDEYYEAAEHLILNNKYPLFQQANVPRGKELKTILLKEEQQTIVRHMNEREVSGKKIKPACVERRNREPKEGKIVPTALLKPKKGEIIINRYFRAVRTFYQTSAKTDFI
uniref:Uncharacterized protein n=1 Tax=Tetranychus urticae TaxID=32264 RepID=T1L3J6_TETUR